MGIAGSLGQQVLQHALAVHQLLCHDARHTQHGQAAVLQLLRAQLIEGRLVRGLQAQRIETQVAVHVVGLQLRYACLLSIGLRSRLPSCQDVLALDQSHEEQHTHPEVRHQVVSLLELVDRWACDLAVEQRIEALSNQDAQESKHRHTAVLQLRLANLLDFACGLSGRQTKRIEESNRRKGTNESLGTHGKSCLVVSSGHGGHAKSGRSDDK
mmetsp:Transcript_28355/g.40376  ORF Transcript_28355/g.40376 Transcript_28355/m.40376 type:complete len:212 (+) Transcript_28355:140-775(+)